MVSTVNPVIRKLQDNSADIEVTNASKIHVDKQNNLYVTSTSGKDAPNKYSEKKGLIMLLNLLIEKLFSFL